MKPTYFVTFLTQIKIFFEQLRSTCVWLLPFVSISILAVYIFQKFPNFSSGITFDNSLKLVAVVIWPVTVIIVSLFFRKVFTYLFFSMNEFNFFGLKGNLKNIHDLIQEKVEIRLAEEKNNKEREEASLKLSEKIKEKESEVERVTGTAEENLELAKELLNSWKKSVEEKDKIIIKLTEETNKLRVVASTPSPSPSQNYHDNTIYLDEEGVRVENNMTTPNRTENTPA